MKMTALEVAIHPEGVNPIFGESSTRVKMGDDGAGSYIIIRQHTEEFGDNEIRLDFDEVESLFEAIKTIEKGKVL